MAKEKAKEGARFLRYFGPLLDALRELGGSGTPDEVVERIAADLKLSDELQNEMLPSGELRFRNQVAFARLYLAWEGLIDSSKRGVWSLTELGRTTHVSLEQSRQIRAKWVRILRQRRKAQAVDSGPESDDLVEEASQLRGYRQEVLDLMQALPSGWL
jgi:restriction system protein